VNTLTKCSPQYYERRQAHAKMTVDFYLSVREFFLTDIPAFFTSYPAWLVQSADEFYHFSFATAAKIQEKSGKAAARISQVWTGIGAPMFAPIRLYLNRVLMM
jgi:hypothetical protein